MRRLAFAALAFLTLSGAGCAIGVGVGTPYAPQTLVVPVSYEANLLTARQCQFRGLVNDPRAADSLGANVVLAFVTTVNQLEEHRTTEVRTRHVSASRSFGWGFSYAKLKGKALLCPEPVVAQLVGWMSAPVAEVSP